MIEILQNRVSYPISILSPNSPTNDEWDNIWKCVASAPDYGALLPYRFIVLKCDIFKNTIKQLIKWLSDKYPDSQDKIIKYWNQLMENTDCMVILYTVKKPNKIYSIKDQEYGAISAVTQFYIALNSLGYGTYWISIDDNIQQSLKQCLGIELENTTITGLFPIGTPIKERKKKRPNYNKFVQYK